MNLYKTSDKCVTTVRTIAALVLTIFLTSTVAFGQVSKGPIKVDIKDSLLFINDKAVTPDSIVQHFQVHFGKPNRKRKGLRYKWHKYIYDDLGVLIKTHSNSVSIDFFYGRIIKVEPQSEFKGTVTINGYLIKSEYSFGEIEKTLYPCKFYNIFNRSLLGTFFSFERGIGNSQKLISIGYHFIANPEARIKPYLIK